MDEAVDQQEAAAIPIDDSYLSVRALKEFRKPFRMALTADASELTGAVAVAAAAVRLLDQIAGRWTAKQAKCVVLALWGHTQDDIADRLDVSQPVVNRSLRAAGWRAVEEFLHDTEYSIQGL